MTPRNARILSLSILTGGLTLALLIAGCTPVMLGGGTATAFYIFDRPEVNLTEKNYAAADYLMQAGGEFASKNDRIKAVALQNIAEPQLSTKIGRVISQGVGERLQQLGYNVDLKDVSKGIENDIPYAAPAPNETPDYVLTGTYYNHKSKLDVKLRLVDARNERAVAQFDYSMPMSREIESMTKPKPRIMRTPNGQQQTNR